MKNVPRGLVIAILIGMLAGLTLGFFVNYQSNHEQLVFQEGPSISILTEKIDFELGEHIYIKIVNSGTIPLTFSDASYGLKVTGLDGVLYYTPMAAQVLKVNYEKEGESLEFPVSVYNSAAGGIQSGFSLALLSTDLSTVPGGATSWSSSDDMKTWTFNIDPDLTWSDGVPLTAHDYVYTWQYYADPEHAYDFTWYFGMLEVENYGAIEAGEKALDTLGVTATDDKTLVFQLDTPAPYVPGFMMYGSPLAKHAAEKHGQYYSNDPATTLSSTPWILKEWVPNQHAEFEPNVNYTGKIKPFIENYKAVYGERKFDAYLAGEVDTINGPFTPADQEYMENDAKLM